MPQSTPLQCYPLSKALYVWACDDAVKSTVHERRRVRPLMHEQILSICYRAAAVAMACHRMHLVLFSSEQMTRGPHELLWVRGQGQTHIDARKIIADDVLLAAR